MSPTVFLLVSLCLTSALLALIFWIAWRSFGRDPHALTWSLAFGFATLQWILNLSRSAFGDWRVYWTAANALSLAAVTLALIGHRQRAGRPTRAAALAGGAAADWLAVVWATWGATHVGLRTALQPAYAGILLCWAAVILYRFRPHPLPAEKGAAAVHAAFGLSQIAAAGVALLQGAAGDQSYLDLYLMINFLVMPAAYTGMGLFVVFILASDLAERMRQLAATDPLTRVLNRHGFEEAAARVLAQAQRGRQALSLVLGDIDRFKSVNDTWGHAAGDAILVALAEQMRRGRRADDLVARIGGEEFAVLLPNTGLEEAVELAERIRRSLGQVELDMDGERLTVTASFGVASRSRENVSFDALLRAADRALYRAKQRGRDRVERDPAMEATTGASGS